MIISAIIPHYFKERLPNYERILKSLETVERVVIWNNDTADQVEAIEQYYSKPRPQLVVVTTDHNWGCQGRFEAVKYIAPGTTHVLFHDNDIVAQEGSLDRMMHESEQHRYAIISGRYGHRIYKGKIYRNTWGQYELIPIGLVHQLLEGWQESEISKFDDLWLSARAHKLGIPIRGLSLRFSVMERNVGFRFTTERLAASKVFRQLMETV